MNESGRTAGVTPLVACPGLREALGLPRLYLKLEGANPTGTHKDRVAHAQVRDALYKGAATVALATCGNLGCAMALAASEAQLHCLIAIPGNYHVEQDRLAFMRARGAEIRVVPGHYEDAVAASSELASREGLYDANPGGANAEVQLSAYKGIASEIVEQLGHAPTVVGVPVSNGTTVAGIGRGFEALKKRGSIAEIPRMIVGSSLAQNPIVASISTGSKAYSPLEAFQEVSSFTETVVNEPLVNLDSFDGQPAFDAIRRSKGWAYGFTDEELTSGAALVKENEGLVVLPAAVAGLLALRRFVDEFDVRPGETAVAVITGRGD